MRCGKPLDAEPTNHRAWNSGLFHIECAKELSDPFYMTDEEYEGRSELIRHLGACERCGRVWRAVHDVADQTSAELNVAGITKVREQSMSDALLDELLICPTLAPAASRIRQAFRPMS
jgi:hypothetical protein